MVYLRTDPVILGFLGRALSLELSAVQQYLAVSRIVKIRGFEDIAEKLRAEAMEEMDHVDRIIGRMTILGAVPNASQLRPVKVGNSLPALIETLKTLETELVSFYEQACQYCIRADDFDNQIFFEQLLLEEREHHSSMSAWQQEYFLKFTQR